MNSLTRRERAEIDWRFLSAIHEIEPELSARAPRRVVARAAPREGGFAARLSHLVLACALLGTLFLGLALGCYAALCGLIWPLGQTTTATITAHETARDADAGDVDRATVLHFQFQVPGATRTYQSAWPVRDQIAADLHNGDTAQVRYFPFAPAVRPLLEVGISPWAHVFAVGAMGLILIVTGGLPLLAFFPQTGKYLVRRGTATVGILVARQGDLATVWFQADSEREARVTEASELLAPTIWNGLSVGDLVTVLYDPRRPRRALIYLGSAFVARQ